MSKLIRVVSVGFHKNQPYLREIKCHKDEQERPIVDGFRFLDASKVFNDDWKANLLALIGDDHAVVSSHGCGCFIYEFLRCKVKTQNVFITAGETSRFASARVKLIFELAGLVASDTGHDIKRELVARDEVKNGDVTVYHRKTKSHINTKKSRLGATIFLFCGVANFSFGLSDAI
ncbi:TPA: hypothetical protein I7259_19975 [Vibrio parahaemolyticus]|uniref:hypothetical protein n=1 Tax=Vibrio parahaemolyticus TaxID=670 RepID=UPI000429BE8A|nr:hypothetical protein [Vibrio parahaemolyticus]ELB2151832.1 hypothetical protein [Vibrio parahaemolyticus]MBE3718191.1 hypothetical protein [Vibrio parahaemolyticus]MBE3923531.1 hypothetical protein [Vibrio parahaemolyticus]MBE4151213.1 hypothetical protein [Vibrio parahaemolyticus]MBE4182337.1 hypothetical protein [Vibrio parahaemolyticus]